MWLFKVAFHLTREDYQKFRNTESIHYVNDLFKLDGADVKPLMDFEGKEAAARMLQTSYKLLLLFTASRRVNCK